MDSGWLKPSSGIQVSTRPLPARWPRMTHRAPTERSQARGGRWRPLPGCPAAPWPTTAGAECQQPKKEWPILFFFSRQPIPARRHHKPEADGPALGQVGAAPAVAAGIVRVRTRRGGSRRWAIQVFQHCQHGLPHWGGCEARLLAKKEQRPASTLLPAWSALDDLNTSGPQGVHQRAGVVFGAVAGIDLWIGFQCPRDGLLFRERGGGAGHVQCRQAGAAKLEDLCIAHGLGF